MKPSNVTLYLTQSMSYSPMYLILPDMHSFSGVSLLFHKKLPPHTKTGHNALPWIFIFSPPVWDGICKDRPAWLPDTLQHPFLLQHTPDAAPAASFSGRGIIIIQFFKTACQRCPMPEMPLIFFLLLLRFLVPPASKPCHLLLCRQVFLREALLSSLFGTPNVLYP